MIAAPRSKWNGHSLTLNDVSREPICFVRSNAIDVLIDHVLEVLLAAALVCVDVALLEHVSFQFREADFTGFDLGTDSGIPSRVAVLHEIGQFAAGTNRSSDLQTFRERVHSADVSVEQIDGLERFTTHLGVEVHATGADPAVLQNHQHGLGGQVVIGWELVGVPTQQQITRVGVDAAQSTLYARVIELVHHRVTRQRRVVGFDVELEVRIQIVGSQEVHARARRCRTGAW